jgi:hypothetical protein
MKNFFRIAGIATGLFIGEIIVFFILPEAIVNLPHIIFNFFAQK